MVKTSEVYYKIKEISDSSFNPRPRIMIQALANELMTVREQLMPLLKELKDMRLVCFCGSPDTDLRLTLLGHNADW